MDRPPDSADSFRGTERFRPLAFLGRGSMGMVYRVLDVETGAEVALKTFATRAPAQLYQLKREFRSLADTLHPNLVELYELFAGDAAFFTMELIDGVDLLAHLRGEGDGVDLQRFVAVARQLVSGLSAVHAAGKLHRDVKPSNVLVARDGRVVVLDFGLVTALGGDGAMAREVAGTPAYMAPEQFRGAAPTAASDWYSTGAIFYEALTGRLPFPDPVRAFVLHDGSAPPALRELNPKIPATLVALVLALLDPDPARRPATRDILAQLGEVKAAPSSVLPAGAPFVGRAHELGRLRGLVDRAPADAMTIACVTGPSGIGKSELLRRVTAEAEAAGAVVLKGRCNPQEVMPYKAFDGVVDALADSLLSLPQAIVTALVPPFAAALVRLFPVLGAVPAFAAGPPLDDDVELHDVRRRGFAALRELLFRLAQRQPLLVWIDDLQWSDRDSGVLLRELLRPPRVPPALLLLSFRTEGGGEVPVLAELGQELPDGAARRETIELGPLEPADCAVLARALCEIRPDATEPLERAVSDAGGNPFFVGELARSWNARGERPTLALDEVIVERVRQLPLPAQRLLDVVSVAGSPLQRSVVLEAARLGERARPLVSSLEKRTLLRTLRRDQQVAVEIYHDRIREALLAALSEDDVRQHHGGLADVLEEQSEPDAEALFRHSLGAGRRERAAAWGVRAADGAADALAFDRAAELYRQTLALQPQGVERGPLHVKLGEALANAGRGELAGQSFETAAALLPGGTETGAQRALRLRMQAADQFLRAGELHHGADLLRDVLVQVGIGMPRTSRIAMLSALLERLRLLARGLSFERRAIETVPPRVLLRIDACWAATTKLSVLDTIFADAVGVRCLRESLKVGDRTRIIRALAFEAARAASVGVGFFDRHSRRLIREVERLAQESGDPYDRAWLHQCIGGSAYFGGRWRRGHEGCSASAALWRAQCRGVAWEIATADAFALTALAQMGRLPELSERLAAALTDAEERGDIYAVTGLRLGMPCLTRLARGEPESVREMADDAISRWPRERFLVQHYLYLLAAVQADIYLGDVWRAWERLCEAWPRIRESYILNVAVARVDLRYLRGRAALAAASVEELPSGAAAPDPAWPRQRLLREASREARRLARERFAAGKPLAALLRGGIARSSDQESDAAAWLERAAELTARVDMELHAAAARRGLGKLRGGDGGRVLYEEAEAWMRARDVTSPERMQATLAPGCGDTAECGRHSD